MVDARFIGDKGMMSPSTRLRVTAAVLVGVMIVAAVAFLAMRPQPSAPQVIYGNGRIEVDEVRIGAEVAGRLLEVKAEEGAPLEEGALVARIDDKDYLLQADRAAAQKTAAMKAVARLDPQIEVARHHAETARTDLRRGELLESQGALATRDADQLRNANEAAQNLVRSLMEQKAEAAAQVEIASTSLALARSQIAKTKLAAPISGWVLQRLVEPGEVVAPGQPVAVLANLATVRLKVFIAERDLGKVRLGASARIRVDAFPEQYFSARVSQVDSQAQFTPRDVHMEDERARTVYGVTLQAPNADGSLKAGMPADAWILWDERQGWPDRLRIPE